MSIIKNEYWRQRIEAEMLAKQQREGVVDYHLQALYQHHFTNIEREIQLFYQRYADVNGIDIAEAKKRASEMDVRFFADKARRYVEEKNFSPEANKELALYNLKMKVSRAELLQYHIDLELLALTNGEHQLAERFLSQAYVDELKAQAGILGESLVSTETLKHKAESLLNVPYEGATWSSRIWRRHGELRLYVAKLAHETLVRGRSSLTMISTIRKQMNVSKASAKRLVVTETARLQTQAQKDVYLANEFEEYEYIAEPSACPICKALDGKTFKVKSMEPGENASPMHPHCHCSTAPFVDREKFWEEVDNSLKEEVFNTFDDPIREVMGSAFESHPEETAKLLYELGKMGVEIIWSDKEGMTYQPTKNVPGQIRINKEASYSALLHEYTHAVDDRDSGWQAYRYLYEDDNKYIKLETRAYDAEIQFSRLNGVPESYIIRLQELKEREIIRIKSRWSQWLE